MSRAIEIIQRHSWIDLQLGGIAHSTDISAFFDILFILYSFISRLILFIILFSGFVKSNNIRKSGLQQSDVYSIERNGKSRDSRKKLLVNGNGNVEIAENAT